MFRSFRFRLVALSVLVSAVALLVFAGVAWTLITRDQGRRFDLELENLAAKYTGRLLNLALRGVSPEQPNMVQLRDQLDASGAAYAVVTGNGRVAWRSDSWPSTEDPAAYARYALPGNPMGQNQGPQDQFGNPSPDDFPQEGQRGFRGGQRGRRGSGGGGGPQQQFFPDQPGQFPNDGQFPNNGQFPNGRGPQGNQPRPGGMPVIRTDLITYYSVPAGNPTWRLAAVPLGGGVALFALPLQHLSEERANARDIFLIALPVALGLIALGAALLASRAVAPIRKLSAVAGRITAEGLLERIPREGEDSEFARLIDVFNAMLDRLARSFDQARRFSHDAAHELNTPLTVLMGQIDQALHAAPVGSLEQQRWAILAEEVQRLRDIVRKLLTLARADRGALRPDRQAVDFSRLVRDCAEDAAAASEGIDFSITGDESLPIEGDPALLRQILYNLLSNAVKYNRPGGFVRIHLWQEKRENLPWAGLSITNAGPAISPEQAAHVFDRFFRGDFARPRTVEGLGLGLSLAREFARAHGGELGLAKNAQDAVTFQLDLPAATL